MKTCVYITVRQKDFILLKTLHKTKFFIIPSEIFYTNFNFS